MDSIQGNNLYEYFAFISYKREDEKWAKWLQRKLEYYKLPSSVRKDNPDLPEKIRPVFKDTTDLEPGVLAQKIQDALKASRFLIVICSPRSANSVWVSKEVQSFIDSGRADCIIPFIIGGTPNASNPEEECFPEGLRLLAGEQELLGANINEMGREAAAIKVVARMFDLRFDTLWQRFVKHKRKTMLCIVILSIIFAIICLCVGSYISRQNILLEKTNAEMALQRDRANNERNRANSERDRANAISKDLIIANDSVKKSNAKLDSALRNLDLANNNLRHSNYRLQLEKYRVKKALDEVKTEQVISISKSIQNQLNTGRLLLAANHILDYVPHDNNGQPFVPIAMDILNQVIGMLSKDGYKQIDVLPNDIVSPNGRWCAYNEAGEYFLYDIHSQKNIKLKGEDRIDFNEIFFSNDGSFLYGIGNRRCYEWSVKSHDLLNSWDIENELYDYFESGMNNSFSPQQLKGVIRYTSNHMSEDKRWGKYSVRHFDGVDSENEKKLSLFCNTQLVGEVIVPEEFNINRQYNYCPNAPVIAYGTKDGHVEVIDLTLRNEYPDHIYETPEFISLLNNGDEISVNLKLFSRKVVNGLYATPICIYKDSISMSIDSKAYATKTHKAFYYNNKEWKLLDTNGYSKLYYEVCEGWGFNELLFINNNNGTPHIFTPFVSYTIGNGLSLMLDAKILDETNILLIAAQGNHSVYNVKSGERRYFAPSKINTYESYYCHAQMFLDYARTIDEKTKLLTVSGGGVFSVFDIASGNVLSECAIMLPQEYIDERTISSIDFQTHYVTDDGKYAYGKLSIYNDAFYVCFKLPSIAEYISYAKDEILNFWNIKRNYDEPIYRDVTSVIYSSLPMK